MQGGGVTGSPVRAAASISSQQQADDSIFDKFAEEVTLKEDRKAETERALLEDLLASLRKEEKLLDADAWKFAAPRSQPKHIS